MLVDGVGSVVGHSEALAYIRPTSVDDKDSTLYTPYRNPRSAPQLGRVPPVARAPRGLQGRALAPAKVSCHESARHKNLLFRS